MKILWNEYAGMVIGIVGAVAVTGIVVSLMAPEGSIYQVIESFSGSIC